MRKITVFTVLFLCALMVFSGAQAAWDITNNVYQAGDVVATEAEAEAGNPVFVMKLQNGGEVRGVLYPDIAPESVGNFIALANSGYYDGLIFHRVVPGFVIQGGDPQGTGTGGPGWGIKGEFASNGVENPLQHTYGVLSMARSSRPDSAGSQFFIVVSAHSPHLDGDYAGFGLVTEGMEYVDEIVAQPRNSNDKPLEDQIIASIRVETFGKEYPFEQR